PAGPRSPPTPPGVPLAGCLRYAGWYPQVMSVRDSRAAPDRPLTNLLPPPTRFVGRAAALSDLAERVGREALVTILGPPGMGKTRLAVEYALASLGGFPGGAWFCDLTGERDLEGLCASVGRALGIPLVPGETAAVAAQLGRALAGRNRLLL